MRCCLSLHAYDVRNSLHHQWNAENPQAATRLMRKAQAYVRVWMESSCKEGLVPGEAEIHEMAVEFAHEGVAEAVPRYFRDIRKSEPVDYSRFTMPVVYVHGGARPEAADRVLPRHGGPLAGPGGDPGAGLRHFVTRERPEQMTRAMMWFYNSMLGAGVSLFDRSRHYGLPTRPVKPRAGWGVNAFARISLASPAPVRPRARDTWWTHDARRR